MKRMKLFEEPFRRLVSLLLALSLSATAFAAGLSPIRSLDDAGFTDIPYDWSREGIAACYELGLMSGVGYGLFSPAGTVSVAEGIIVAGRIHHLWQGGDGVLPQKEGSWYAGGVDYALEQGILTQGQFSEYLVPASRAQLAGLLAKALPGSEYAPINHISALPDVTAATPYADEIFTLYNAGILTGSDSYGTFRPNTSITRAELAAILCRLVQPEKRKTLSLAVQPTDLTVRSTSRKLYLNGDVPLAGVVEMGGKFLFPLELFSEPNGLSYSLASSYEDSDAYSLSFSSYSWQGEIPVLTYWCEPPQGHVMGLAQPSSKPLYYGGQEYQGVVYTLGGKYPMVDLSIFPISQRGIDLVLDLGFDPSKYTLVPESDLVGGPVPSLLAANDRDTLRNLHDYLVNTLTYDPLISAPRGTTQAQLDAVSAAFDAAYGKYSFPNNVTLETKYGVCQNYGEVFFAMCTRAGIPCRTQPGMAGGDSHLWNQVYVDGQWLYVDCTWDDPVSAKPELRTTYFLVGPDAMVKSHYWDGEDYPMPKEYDPAWALIDPNAITSADEYRKCLIAQLMQGKTSFSLRTVKSGAYGGSACVYAYPVGFAFMSGGYNSSTNTYDYTVEYW